MTPLEVIVVPILLLWLIVNVISFVQLRRKAGGQS